MGHDPLVSMLTAFDGIGMGTAWGIYDYCGQPDSTRRPSLRRNRNSLKSASKPSRRNYRSVSVGTTSSLCLSAR